MNKNKNKNNQNQYRENMTDEQNKNLKLIKNNIKKI